MRKYMEQKEKEVTKQARWKRKTNAKKNQSNTNGSRREYSIRHTQPTRKYLEQKDFFRTNIAYKPDDTIRIGFKNTHRFLSANNDVKFDYLKAESAENGHGFNIQSFGETN